MANVILQCSAIRNNGSVAISGRLDQCPYITGLTATSLQAPVGGTITVMVQATELDPTDTITYAWTNDDTATGSLAPTNAASAVFTCLAVGDAQLSVTVSDGICGDTRANAIPIVCTAGGAGGAGPGGSGGAGTGGAGTGGTAPGGTGGAGTGGTGPAGTGGGGSGGSAPGGTGGGGTGGGGTGGTGPVGCFETNPPAGLLAMCDTCLDTNQNTETDGCCGITDATGLALCQTVSSCMRSGGTTGTSCNLGGDVTTCFCGTNQATCDQAGQPNGPCVAQATAAAGRNVVTGVTDSPTPAQVLARQGDPAYALGRAANIHGIAALFCTAECGF